MEWFTAPDYWLSRLVFQRALAGVYLVAFLTAARQFRPLIGEHGMLPIPRLLENDRDTLRLLRSSPFPPDTPPRYVRARLFRYRYTSWRELRETGACWERTFVREYLPPTRLAAVAQRP